ncbi:TIM barrel protein [Halopiger aswanensis]|uniref:Hydroxypyruvate isomerase n=1 Tax=Halopiger aswanensis TaxID=148449 RepID=A0A3R7KIS3_9EURY|nr:TIM barrel protein [Halopiger aswanensis]RKD88879.1 hydroxypyruvate isomerase [Halopiger aswanensis]
MVEPLNNPVNHRGYYLDSSYAAYEIVDAVDSPVVSVLFDVYHQQIVEGNVIANLTENLEFVGYVHVADVPGRHEPGTGELNYWCVFEALDEAGYDGYVGLEYAPATFSATLLAATVSLHPSKLVPGVLDLAAAEVGLRAVHDVL